MPHHGARSVAQRAAGRARYVGQGDWHHGDVGQPTVRSLPQLALCQKVTTIKYNHIMEVTVIVLDTKAGHIQSPFALQN